MRCLPVVLVLSGLLTITTARASEPGDSSPRVVYLKPAYVPPGELSEMIGVRFTDARGLVEWRDTTGGHAVEVRRNDAANLLIFSGEPADVAAVEALAKAADLPPRQIAIEARIVEVNETKARALGIDWDQLVRSSGAYLAFRWEEFKRSSDRNTFRELSASANVNVANSLRLLEENNALTTRNAPRILTLNNRRADILDGQRATYVTRYSTFTNLFATDSMDAGLKLSVLPSLGQSGYLTLNIRAELTTFVNQISGSPVKDGQMVENTVIVKDGETVLLGGFQRESEQRVRRTLPIIGHVLPFLFSRNETTRTTTRSFVMLTPRVVDLAPPSDPGTEQPEGRH